MATRFTHVTLPQRVRFGRGLVAEHLEEEVGRLGARRVMVVSTGREERDRPDLLDGIPVALRWREVRQHVPAEEAERARLAARAAGADLLLALGGGSAVGLAKAVALTDGIPVVAVPTTYAGSESTDVWGLTQGGTKTTGTDPAVLPVAVVYDPALTDRMPADLAVASGLNALAHCVDALWAPRADPVNRALALEGARLLAPGLRAVAAGTPGETRDGTLLGAHLAAVAFASAGSGLHHKVCHVLGGTYDLPHAATHAVVLPHVLALNARAVPDAVARLADALGTRNRDLDHRAGRPPIPPGVPRRRSAPSPRCARTWARPRRCATTASRRATSPTRPTAASPSCRRATRSR